MSDVNIATAKNGLVGESQLSYTPPMAGEEENLNDLAKSVIDEIQGEFDQEDGRRWTGEDGPGADPLGEAAGGDGDDPDQTSTTGEPSDELQKPDEQDIEADPKNARFFERVVQRELAAKEQEAKAAATLAQVTAKIEEYKGLQGLKSTKELMEMAANDPAGVMTALGQDPAHMIKLALAQQLGDKAPPELQEFAKNYARDREVADLRAQIARSEQSRAQQDYFNSVVNGAREYVSKSVGDSTPTLAIVAKANPERAHKEIMEEIQRDAQTRGATDPNGEPLTYPEAAKRVEARMAEWKSLLGVQNSMSTASTKSTQKPNGTTPPQSKPPAKPLRPWEQKNNLEDQGIQDALREFHKMEAAARSRR
jgi:hypothetical protein